MSVNLVFNTDLVYFSCAAGYEGGTWEDGTCIMVSQVFTHIPCAVYFSCAADWEGGT